MGKQSKRLCQYDCVCVSVRVKVGAWERLWCASLCRSQPAQIHSSLCPAPLISPASPLGCRSAFP